MIVCSLFKLEDALERDKRQRGDLEKSKRKVEGELRVLQENFDELARQKIDAENSIKK